MTEQEMRELLIEDGQRLRKRNDELEAENAALRERLAQAEAIVDNLVRNEVQREARLVALEQREREARAIIEFVAGCDIGPMSRRLLMWQYDDADTYLTQARAWLAAQPQTEQEEAGDE